MHPACGCLDKRRLEIVKKMIGATLVDSFIEFDGYYTYLNTKYQIGSDEKQRQFCVSAVIENCSGDHAIHETLFQIDIEAFDSTKKSIKDEADRIAKEEQLQVLQHQKTQNQMIRKNQAIQ